jgi:peptide/nickel transport system ATP-binding protein
MSNVLTVKDLKVYLDVDAGLVKAVDGVSFRIPAGRTMAWWASPVLASPSWRRRSWASCRGWPASSTVQILLRDPRQPGTVVDIARLDMARAADAFHPGRPYFHHLPGADDGAVAAAHDRQPDRRGAGLHRSGIGKAERSAAVVEMLRLVGFPDPVKAEHTYPFELSGGLRQRAMIAMALVCRPALLIADEPTTALDVTIQAQILQLMKQLQRELQMAMMMITHDLGIVANMADEVVVMYHGKVMEAGTLAGRLQGPAPSLPEGLCCGRCRASTWRRASG